MNSHLVDGNALLAARLIESFPQDLSPTVIGHWNSLKTEVLQERLKAVFLEPFPEEILPKGWLQGLKNPIEVVMRRTAESCNVDVKLFRVKRRHSQPIADARMLAMFICYKWDLGSYDHIGIAFRRDSTSVLHANQRIPELLKQMPGLRLQYQKCLRLLTEDCRKAALASRRN